MRALLRRSAALVVVAAIAACDGSGGFDAGAADVFITYEGEELHLVHDPLYSQVSTTPPTGGVVQVTFSFQDPQVTLDLEVDSNQVLEGATVNVPASGARLDVEVNGELFSSDQSGSSGQLTFDVLRVDETVDAAEVIVRFDTQLSSSEGNSVAANGSVEGRVGTFSDGTGETDDGAAQVSAEVASGE